MPAVISPGTGGGDSSANIIEVNQDAHGFTEGDAVYTDLDVWTLADGSDAGALGFGVISVVLDVDNFTVVLSGLAPIAQETFSINALLFLDPATPGLLTETRPTAEGNFQNPIAFVKSPTEFIIFPWRYEQVPEISNRLLLTSTAEANFTSTAHAFQIGSDGAPRTKMSPNRISSVDAVGTREPFVIEAQNITLRDPGSGSILIQDTFSIPLTDGFQQRIDFETDSGAVEHARFGLLGNDGFGLRNKKTGDGNRNIELRSESGTINARSAAVIPLDLRSPTTVAIGTDYTQNIHYTTDDGAVLHSTVGLNGADGLVLENFKTGTTNASITLKATTNATVVIEIDSDLPLTLRSIAAVLISADYEQLISFQTDTGAVEHGIIGFSDADGLLIENFKTGAGTNKNLTLRTVGGTAIVETTNDFAFNLLTPTVVALSAGHTQKIQYQTGGGVVQAQIGFEGQFVIRNNKTGSSLRDIVFGLSEVAAAVIAPRLITTAAVVPTLTSTDHPFQVGADGAFRLKFGVGIIKAVNASDAVGNMQLEAGQIRLMSDAGTGFVRIENDNTVPLRLESPDAVSIGTTFTQRVFFSSDGGAVVHAAAGMATGGGYLIDNFKTNAADSIIFLRNVMADTFPLLKLSQTGTGGADTQVHSGTTSPSGRVSAPAGSLFVQSSDGTSNMYINRSVGTGTTWTAFI